MKKLLPVLPKKLKHDCFILDADTVEFLQQVEYIRSACHMDREEFVVNLAQDYIPVMAALDKISKQKIV